MGTIILYSSLTGNTKSVAEAMASVMPEGTPCVPVKEAPANLGDYDTVFLGFNQLSRFFISCATIHPET